MQILLNELLEQYRSSEVKKVYHTGKLVRSIFKKLTNTISGAIRSSQPYSFYITDTNIHNSFQSVPAKCSYPKVVEILNRFGFCNHYRWSTLLCEAVLVNDGCRLFWEKGKGLYLHFEALTATYSDGSEIPYGDYQRTMYKKHAVAMRQLIIPRLPGFMQHEMTDEDMEYCIVRV